MVLRSPLTLQRSNGRGQSSLAIEEADAGLSLALTPPVYRRRKGQEIGQGFLWVSNHEFQRTRGRGKFSKDDEPCHLEEESQASEGGLTHVRNGAGRADNSSGQKKD